MSLNRSLVISKKIHECKSGKILGLLAKEFPASVLEEPTSKKAVADFSP